MRKLNDTYTNEMDIEINDVCLTVQYEVNFGNMQINSVKTPSGDEIIMLLEQWDRIGTIESLVQEQEEDEINNEYEERC